MEEVQSYSAAILAASTAHLQRIKDAATARDDAKAIAGTLSTSNSLKSAIKAADATYIEAVCSSDEMRRQDCAIALATLRRAPMSIPATHREVCG
jgi:hypothetical protein